MKKIYLFLLAFMCSVGMAWAGEVTHLMSSYDSTNKVYTATDNQSVVWGLSTNCSTSNQLPGNWTSTTAADRGICFSKPNSVTVTSQSTFTNVTSVVVRASSNMTNVDGTISVTVGGTTLGTTASLTKTNHTTYEFTSATPLSGAIVLTLNQTASSIWIAGLKITTSDSGSQGGDGDDDTPSITAENTLNLTTEESDGTFEVAWTAMEDMEVNLYSDEECTSEFDGSWFQVELDDDNNVYYIVEENTHATTRTVYMQLYGIDADAEDYIHVVTVTQAAADVAEAGTYEISVNNSLFGTSYTGATSGVDAVSGTKNGVTIAYNKGESSNYYINDSEIRTYGGTSVVVSVATGYVITAITFVNSSNFSADKGTFSNGNWSGLASEVTFNHNGTVGSSRVSVNKITVTYRDLKTGSFTLTEIDGAGWGTYYTDFAFEMPENVEGRLMKDVDGTIKAVTTYAAGTVVPAETGLLLKGTAGKHDVTESWTAATISAEGNLLKGSVEGGTTTGGNVYYKLANDSEDGLGWYWGAEGGVAFTCGAHKAYLALDAAPSLAPAVIHITDETETATGIENIEAEQVVKFIENGQIYILKNGNVYNVAGQLIR